VLTGNDVVFNTSADNSNISTISETQQPESTSLKYRQRYDPPWQKILGPTQFGNTSSILTSFTIQIRDIINAAWFANNVVWISPSQLE
jgi:hypothetical protein